MVMMMPTTADPRCYRLPTAAAVKLVTGMLTKAGRSYHLKIHKSRKIGRYFLLRVLD